MEEERLRPVTQLDLLFGLDKMKESKKASAFMLPGVPEVALDWPPACGVPPPAVGGPPLPHISRVCHVGHAVSPVDEDSRAGLHHKLPSQCTVFYHLRSWSEGFSSAFKIYFSPLSHFLRYLFSTLPFFFNREKLWDCCNVITAPKESMFFGNVNIQKWRDGFHPRWKFTRLLLAALFDSAAHV